MKRVRRWMFNGVAGLSVLSCLSVLFLWCYSYHRSRSVGLFWYSRQPCQSAWIEIYSARGISSFRWGETNYVYEHERPNNRFGRLVLSGLFDGSGQRWPGFPMQYPKGILGDMGFAHYPSWAFLEQWTMPIWALVVVTGMPFTIWLYVASRGRKRREEGCCVSCGYDLRATPERCPECGTVPGLRQFIADRAMTGRCSK